MKNLILLSFLFLSPITWAGKDGNGGGSVRVDGKLVTLSEAGINVGKILIPEKEALRLGVRGVDFRPDINREVRAILSRLTLDIGLQDRILEEIFTFDIIYIEVDKLEKQLLRSVRKSYLEAFKLIGQKQKTKNIVIDAVSRRNITYIVKPEFDSMSLRSQALRLIHEGLYRNLRQDRLIDVLRVDREIVKILNAQDEGKDFDPTALYYGLHQLGMMGYHISANLMGADKISVPGFVTNQVKQVYVQADTALFGHLLRQWTEQSGELISLVDLFYISELNEFFLKSSDKCMSGISTPDRCYDEVVQFSHKKAEALESVIPGISRHLSNFEIESIRRIVKADLDRLPNHSNANRVLKIEMSFWDLHVLSKLSTPNIGDCTSDNPRRYKLVYSHGTFDTMGLRFFDCSAASYSDPTKKNGDTMFGVITIREAE